MTILVHNCLTHVFRDITVLIFTLLNSEMFTYIDSFSFVIQEHSSQLCSL
jgi:hypothetical protein